MKLKEKIAQALFDDVYGDVHRARAMNRAKLFLHYTRNGYGRIQWDDGSVTEAGDQAFEDAAQASAGIMIAQDVLRYEKEVQRLNAIIATMEDNGGD